MISKGIILKLMALSLHWWIVRDNIRLAMEVNNFLKVKSRNVILYAY